jgi:hypothetical protein
VTALKGPPHIHYKFDFSTPKLFFTIEIKVAIKNMQDCNAMQNTFIGKVFSGLRNKTDKNIYVGLILFD